MKRPEGFDRPAAPAERASARPGASRTATLTRPPREDAPAPPARPDRRRDPAREAKAQLRAAQRARRREERREVRRFTRRARRRRVAWLSAGVVVLTVIGLLAVAVYSPLLALRHVQVQGTSRLDAAQLERAVDGQLGTPLALLDENRITRELRPFSLIRSYAVEIVPPDTMVIHVVERTPIGVLPTGSGFQLVDPAGVPVADSESRPAGVPLIQLPDGQGVKSAAYRAMAEVLVALPPDLLAKIDTISATTRDDVGFTLTGGSQKIVWGTADDSAAKAQTLAAMPEYRSGQAGTFTVSSPTTAIFLAG